MARQPAISDEQIVKTLSKGGKRRKPLTAAQVGVPASRLKRLVGLHGIVEAGTQKTGTRGRPAQLFTVEA